MDSSIFSWTYLAVVKRLFLGAGLDEELVRQSSVLCAITIAVRGNPACLPVSIKSSLKTCVGGKTHTERKKKEETIIVFIAYKYYDSYYDEITGAFLRVSDMWVMMLKM